MANPNRRAGLLFLKIDGVQHDVKGNFTYRPGFLKKDEIVGHDRVHGYKALPMAPFIEGEITDRRDLKLQDLLNIENATATLQLANGKTFVLREAFYAGEGQVQTEEANIQLRLVGMEGEEIAAS